MPCTSMLILEYINICRNIKYLYFIVDDKLLLWKYPQFARNNMPQNGIISSFSALSSIGVLISNAFFVCLENEGILFP